MQHETRNAEDAPPDVAASLAIIASQEQRVRSGAVVDGRQLFVAWGVAWIVGYGGLWLATKDLASYETPSGAFILLGVCILGAIVFTIVHTVRRSAGLRGPSVTAGARYGWTWCLGFVTHSALMGGLVNAGASQEIVALAANGIACLIVGLLYMASGAFEQEPALFWLGVWILVVAATSSAVGLPATYLVMALAGGGGLLVGAVVEHLLQQRRQTRAGTAHPA